MSPDLIGLFHHEGHEEREGIRGQKRQMPSFGPGVVTSVELNRIANHTIEKVIEFPLRALRALRVLRGNFPPIPAAEAKRNAGILT